MRKGFYLDDISLNPIPEKRNGALRNKYLMHSGSGLVKRLSLLEPKPRAIIIVGKRITHLAMDFRDEAGLSTVPTWYLPFPRGKFYDLFVEKLTSILRQQS